MLHEHPGPLMNLLGEVVVDLYEEIFTLKRPREQEQIVMIEYTMRLDHAMAQGGDEWEPFRYKSVDTMEIALVAVNAWAYLNKRNQRDYTDLEGIQRILRKDGYRVAMGLMARTKRQGAAFGYFIRKPEELKQYRGRNESSPIQTKRTRKRRFYRPQ